MSPQPWFLGSRQEGSLSAWYRGGFQLLFVGNPLCGENHFPSLWTAWTFLHYIFSSLIRYFGSNSGWVPLGNVKEKGSSERVRVGKGEGGVGGGWRGRRKERERGGGPKGDCHTSRKRLSKLRLPVTIWKSWWGSWSCLPPPLFGIFIAICMFSYNESESS